jgi:glycine betaine/proline transport system substrate-binding protein
MTAALSRAIKRQKWIVVTGWSPHWMFARWKLRYLEDPRGSLGGRERIHALVRKGFYQDFPVAVTEFLSRMFIPMDELEQLMAAAAETSYEDAVNRYIEQHPDRVNYWVTGLVCTQE